MIYLDNAATTPLKPEVKEAMIKAMDMFGNPSSNYSLGRDARKVISECRKKIAEKFKVKPNEIIFTSGGSESNNMTIKGVVFANPHCHIITSTIEHPSVLNTCRQLERLGFEVTYLSVDKAGLVNLEELKSSIKENTKMISIMGVNNETGTVQDCAAIYNIAQEYNVLYHMDAVQATGFTLSALPRCCDMMSMSAHKFGAPKQTGILIAKEGIELEPLICGGSQEFGRRAGTENIINIVGMTTAVELLCKDKDVCVAEGLDMRDLNFLLLKKLIEIDGVSVNGSGDCIHLNVCIKDGPSETVVEMLSMNDIYVSSGSACSQGKTPYVLKAIGLTEEEANSSIRFSLSKNTTKEDIETTVKVLKGIVDLIRSNRGK